MEVKLTCQYVSGSAALILRIRNMFRLMNLYIFNSIICFYKMAFHNIAMSIIKMD